MALAATAAAVVAAAAKGRRRKLLRKGQLNCIKFNNFCTKRSEPNQVEQLRNVCRPAAATRKHIKAAKGFRPADYVQNRHGGQKHVRTQHIVRPTTRSDNNNNNSNTRSNNNGTTYVCKGFAQPCTAGKYSVLQSLIKLILRCFFFPILGFFVINYDNGLNEIIILYGELVLFVTLNVKYHCKYKFQFALTELAV